MTSSDRDIRLEKFVSVIRNQYPDLKDLADLNARTRNLIADQSIELPLAFFKSAQDTVHTLFHKSRAPERLAALHDKFTAAAMVRELAILDNRPKNLSVLMAYDFHYDFATGQTSLIEVNTNASGFLFSDAIYRAFNIDPYASSHSPLKGLSPLEVLLRSFERESEMALQRKPHGIALIDENIEQQKMYFEFLMYRNLFRQRGYSADIFEFDKLPASGFDFIYNRHTDFFLSDLRARSLLETFWSGAICLSPHPFEYLILSHKERLIEFAAESLAATLIPTFDVQSVPAEKLWADRKSLFFKPKSGFGAKATYKGASITRGTFDEVVKGDYIAQEFRPPGRIGEWKFDVRCYAYADEIQLVVARIYQGQVTNFSTVGGGFAPVVFR
jgi:hypothetical protein